MMTLLQYKQKFFLQILSASQTYKIYHKDLAADTTDNGVVAPLVLESGDILKIQVATANKIEGVVSYLEIFDEKSA